jgi:virginiamycin A acetyltransferase
LPAPDPTTIHPVAGQERVVFLRPLPTSPNISIGDFGVSGTPAELEAVARENGLL